MGYRLSIDVGGTFTDVVCFDEASKQIYTTKSSSTPHDYSEGIISGIEKIAKQIGLDSYEQISYFIHGTTVATNALLERKGSKTAVITTQGFRDVLEIANQTRPDLYNFWAKRSDSPIPRHLVFEVPERILYNGQILKELDEKRARQVVGEVLKHNVEAVAVCFLHSYANTANEQRMKGILEEMMPEVCICISSEILPEIKEYERFCTTAVNVYLMPKVQEYINRLIEKKDHMGIKTDVHVMQSNAGIMSADFAAKRSVHTVFSGPSGGVLSGMYMSRLLKKENLITLDIGGTSTDLALIENGEPHYTNMGEIGGFPVKVPMVEIHTIGAGGGSIAWVDTGGGLRVGPQSAGAFPGPACYGAGGDQPTVTDANFILGRINPDYFLGGEMELSREKAEQAIQNGVASKIGLSIVETASGIISLVNSNMCGGINVISVQKGYDLREFWLLAFGGAGPLHAVALSDELGMKGVIIPPAPGNLSAIGAQLAQVRYDYVRTKVASIKAMTLVEYNRIFSDMGKEAATDLTREGYAQPDILLTGSADVRYAGQAWELAISVPIALQSEQDLQQIIEDFHAVHERMYGYRLEEEDVVFVNLRLSAVGQIPLLEFPHTPARENRAEQALKGERRMYTKCRYEDCPVYDREKLTPGSFFKGPAVVEEYASTTLVLPGYLTKVDEYNCMLIEKEGA